MDYRLTWYECWSTQREADDPRVLIRYEEQDDGWWEHQCHLYFNADSNQEARKYVEKYIAGSSSIFEVYTLVNRATKQVVMTEEVGV